MSKDEQDNSDRFGWHKGDVTVTQAPQSTEARASLTQVQIIQSLAEALSWFEKELSWGAPSAELSHLTGRIGELYAAMITRGQMALATHQRGYDVISAENERISVKTVTSSSQVTFNKNTFALVDRVMVLRVRVDDDNGLSVETLLDCPASEFITRFVSADGNLKFRTGRREVKPIERLAVRSVATFGNAEILQYENGTISVIVDGVSMSTVKPPLRKIAAEIGVDLLNSNSQTKNTRQLGADIIKTLKAREGAG